MSKDMTVQWILNSPIGAIFLVASGRGLHGVHFERQEEPLADSLKGAAPALKILKDTSVQLTEYFQGKRTKFDLPLAPRGTDFQRSVWKALTKIPYGKTSSYVGVAQALGRPKASRAVGGANGKNPICIIIPCHRVIAADGSLGGYSSGLLIKTKLLELEGAPKSKYSKTSASVEVAV